MSLFGPNSPNGFQYQSDLIALDEEKQLLDNITKLTYKPFLFHGYEAKRGIADFGGRYEFDHRTVKEGESLPRFLFALREKAGAFAKVDPQKLSYALVTKYPPGAGIHWHSDAPPLALLSVYL